MLSQAFSSHWRLWSTPLGRLEPAPGGNKRSYLARPAKKLLKFLAEEGCMSHAALAHTRPRATARQNQLLSPLPPPIRTSHTLLKTATVQPPSTSSAHAQSRPHNDGHWHPCRILKTTEHRHSPRTPHASFDRRQAAHKRHSWHGDARPMSPTSGRVASGRRVVGPGRRHLFFSVPRQKSLKKTNIGRIFKIIL